MKLFSDLHIEKAGNGFLVKGHIVPQSRSRSAEGNILDLGHRGDLKGCEVQIGGTHATRGDAQAAIEKLKQRERAST